MSNLDFAVSIAGAWKRSLNDTFQDEVPRAGNRNGERPERQLV